MTQECIGAEHKCWWVLNTQGGEIKAEQAVTRRNLYRYSDVSESVRETWIRDLDWGQTCQSSRSLLVVSVNFISEYSWNTGWGQRVVLLLTLNWTDGPQPAKEPVKKKKLCRAVLQWSGLPQLIFCTSIRKSALQMGSDGLAAIGGESATAAGLRGLVSALWRRSRVSGSSAFDTGWWRLMCSLYELKPKSEQLRVSIPLVSCERHISSWKEHFAPVIALQGDYAFYRTIGVHLLLPQGVLLKCHFCQADYDKL